MKRRKAGEFTGFGADSRESGLSILHYVILGGGFAESKELVTPQDILNGS
jgi:hypothetical protein